MHRHGNLAIFTKSREYSLHFCLGLAVETDRKIIALMKRQTRQGVRGHERHRSGGKLGMQDSVECAFCHRRYFGWSGRKGCEVRLRLQTLAVERHCFATFAVEIQVSV